jgi:hypothetical protein
MQITEKSAGRNFELPVVTAITVMPKATSQRSNLLLDFQATRNIGTACSSAKKMTSKRVPLKSKDATGWKCGA